MLSSVGLFAGIGGIELGLGRAGFEAKLLCEIDDAAQAVLRAGFPDARIADDVRSLKSIPKVDVLAAGFPCQDLSQAGRTAGIRGEQSGLVDEVFRLIAKPATAPRWLLLENVSFMLRLDRGEAMSYLTSRLASLGWRWAYRVVDSRAFGVPQRRQRVVLLASRTEDPRPVLFSDDTGLKDVVHLNPEAFGFYWTEGERGLGWAIESIPTLKGGSTIGIPSQPAVWIPGRQRLGTISLSDAERCQGFPVDWTRLPDASFARPDGRRWKLLGNAVTTGLAEWVGSRIVNPARESNFSGTPLEPGDPWPNAAWGDKSGNWSLQRSAFPLGTRISRLSSFLQSDLKPLSVKAASGFLGRARRGSLRFQPGFLEAVEAHIRNESGLAFL